MNRNTRLDHQHSPNPDVVIKGNCHKIEGYMLA
jgi:hypothetical protein